jgi:phospholipid/cholesterol/gamma-HCH transport system substrate-binding protein
VPTSSAVGRIAAILALVGAAVVVFLLLLGGGSSYTVTGKFENASQLVPGNTVNVAGVAAGTISDISLADDGQALVEMEVSDEYAPLPQGTHATVRSQSLSGIANRYVDLDLPPASDGEQATIDDGGAIEQVNTTSEVDLDQLFNTLDEETIASFKSVIKGFARSYDGVGPQANKGFRYLNPFLSTSRRVFGELNSDKPALESLLVDSASLTGNLAERGDDIEALVGNLNGMMGAIGRRETELASAIGQLPGFMRQFNTTAFNLRAALDDVDPLVKASRPVARKLKPFARKLRGFTRDAVPTIKSLDGIVRRPGAANDLIELTELQVPLAEIGVGPVTRNGASREGALPASSRALTDGLPALAFLRPYVTAEGVTGWFDDFGHSGFPDPIGGIGRVPTTLNPFTLGAPSIIPGLPAIPLPNVLGALLGIPGSTINLTDFLNDIPGLEAIGLSVGNTQRCPGAHERRPTGTSQAEFDDQLTYDGTLNCDPTEVPPGS